jgi:hypothetical protein
MRRVCRLMILSPDHRCKTGAPGPTAVELSRELILALKVDIDAKRAEGMDGGRVAQDVNEDCLIHRVLKINFATICAVEQAALMQASC